MLTCLKLNREVLCRKKWAEMTAENIQKFWESWKFGAVFGGLAPIFNFAENFFDGFPDF